MTTNTIWTYNNARFIHIELSSLCNAACPNCPRYMYNTEIVNPDLDLTSISIEQFKKWFPIDFVKNSKRWLICGTVGDPMMAKDVYEILEYICLNSNAGIQLNTNGGTRSIEFWKKVGDLFNLPASNRRYIIFSVDGLEDTNHIYRRNVSWDKVYNNMKAYASTGAYSQWDYLIFKHNEHQIEEAKLLAKEIGITDFALKRALGFEGSSPDTYKNMPARDKQGKFQYFIEPPSIEWRNNAQATTEQQIPSSDMNINKTKKTVIEIKNELDYDISKSLSSWKFPEEHKGKTIVCKSCVKETKIPSTEIYVDASGNVMPCCYIGTWFSSYYKLAAAIQIKKAVKDWGPEKINLNNYSLKDILDSGFLNQMFADKWENAADGDKMEHCFSMCGKVDNKGENSVDKIYISGWWAKDKNK